MPEIDPMYEPPKFRSAEPKPRRHWAQSAIGMVLCTILGSAGSAAIFGAFKQAISPSLYGGAAELEFLIGALLLIPALFIYSKMVR